VSSPRSTTSTSAWQAGHQVTIVRAWRMTKRPSVSIVIFVVLTAIASPDFLLNLVALANFMRLCLLKGAHAALSCAAWQEIRVRSGIRRVCGGFE
jgi:hypothetical protein